MKLEPWKHLQYRVLKFDTANFTSLFLNTVRIEWLAKLVLTNSHGLISIFITIFIILLKFKFWSSSAFIERLLFLKHKKTLDGHTTLKLSEDYESTTHKIRLIVKSACIGWLYSCSSLIWQTCYLMRWKCHFSNHSKLYFLLPHKAVNLNRFHRQFVLNFYYTTKISRMKLLKYNFLHDTVFNYNNTQELQQ